MATLLLRLAGPMQSWGTQSRFQVRDSGTEPSKSGVLGLLCAALGKPREEDLTDLRFPALSTLGALKMGVRVDRPGIVQRDYHTVGVSRHEAYGVARANGNGLGQVASDRYYLADADFLVGLESSDLNLLHTLYQALEKPFWPLSLGRKAFVPGVPVHIPGGIRSQPLEHALADHPWFARSRCELADSMRAIARSREQGPPLSVRLVTDADYGTTSETRTDVPIDFASRRFALRHVKTSWVEITEQMVKGDPLLCTSPD